MDTSQRGIPVPRQASSNPPTLIDVAYPRDLHTMSFAPIVVFCVGAIAVITIGVMRVADSAADVLLLAAGALVVAVGFWGLLHTWRTRVVHRVRRHLAATGHQPLSQRVSGFLSLPRGPCTRQAVEELVKTLVRERCFGTAVRIAPPGTAAALEPIHVSFEARAFPELIDLDSADPTGNELERAETSAPAPGRDRSRGPRAIPRGVLRNLLLEGRWIVVATFGALWVFAVVQSLARRTPTLWLMFLSFALIATLLIPAGTGWLTGQQWLAVPGGFLRRKGNWLRARSDLHVFDRRTAACVLYKHQKRQWILAVADGERCESTVGTQAELELALRAWLSPLAPPSLEQLGDLQ